MKHLLLMGSAILMAVNFLLSQEEARLMRFPAIHGDQVVFSYAGDLFTVSRAGGIARRLTSHKGYEMFPRFSPDGKMIAFTGQYDGNTEVYVIPSEGGEPFRVTYTATLKRDDVSDRMGPNNIVMTWKDSQTIVYRSRKKSFNDFIGQLFEVPRTGGLSKQLELPSGGFCSFSPDGKKLAYNQVFREFRTWKYYKGGMADDIWIYDFETRKTINITNHEAQDIFPMWHGDYIYFLSDRDRIMNLFAYNTLTGETRKVTHYTDYDIKFPSLGDQAIIYEKGGFLYVFDLRTMTDEKLSIRIINDFEASRPQWKEADKTIRRASLSYDGNRIVFSSRGDIFSVPAKSGITLNLTNTNGVHEREAQWSPDGQWIAFISDQSGEDEIYIMKPDQKTQPIAITSGADTYKFNFQWSPDSKWIAWHDQMKRLQCVNIQTRQVIQVDRSNIAEISSYSWAPDSRWLVYSLPENGKMTRIWAFHLENRTKKPLTDEWFNSYTPTFSPDGKYLYFVSLRTFNPIYSWTEWNHAYQDMAKIYLITLAASTPSPFETKNDQAEPAREEQPEKTDKKDQKKSDSRKVSVQIDFDGIFERVVEVTSEAGSYWSLTSVEDGLYYIRSRSGEGDSKFLFFNLTDKKETELGKNFSYTISGNGKKMLVRTNDKYSVIDLPKSSIKTEDHVDLSQMKIWVNPRLEWKQIFDETWRQMKYFFYDPGMHGVDWNKMYEKYKVLLPHVNSRYDLTYIIGEMIGELNAGHAYINDGDRILPERIPLGLLGAELSRDKSGYYRIDRILRGRNWTREVRSPLTEPGMDIREGEFIIAINGQSTREMNDIYAALVGKADQPVEITINSKPAETGARNFIIRPIADESELYYYNWVHDNIRKVDEATNGQVGYIHIPDMGPNGLNQFVKYYYPQLRKRALIIDDRGNGGGNVSPMIIERLRRELAMMVVGRNTEGYPKPGGIMVGPMVCLINQYSASDGDLFPYQFRKYNLGPLIGTRTWGGVIGIRGPLPTIDGADLRKPEFAHYSADGSEWIIEGYGVDPDIVVINDPALEYQGIDQQLNKAIEVILEMLKDYPEQPYPAPPPYPDKSK